MHLTSMFTSRSAKELHSLGLLLAMQCNYIITMSLIVSCDRW